MTQEERDRLVTLKKARKRLITQREAAEELEVSERQVRRLLVLVEERGDKAVIHGLTGNPSNRKLAEELERTAIQVLTTEAYRGFGPTLAGEHLSERHGIQVSKETLRQWMMRAKLWRGKRERMEKIHPWRPRRSRWGELVQWDTSEHEWLEGRGEKLYLIAMIDDATSRLQARFVQQDSTQENMRLLWSYVERFGRPMAFYTDKASLFQTAVKTRRGQQREGRDQPEMGPTQIGRALRELGIVWIGAHSPQAKGRVERGFGTAQDRLVKGMRVEAIRTMEEANRYLEQEYLPWWDRRLTVEPAEGENAHRRLGKEHNLAAILSHVESRQVGNDYTLRYQGRLYQIDRKAISTGLRGSNVRVEKRLDGTIHVRFHDRYLPIEECQRRPRPEPVAPPKQQHSTAPKKKKSNWNKNFDLKKAPKVWQAALGSSTRDFERSDA